jgi:hypothetical protein
VFKRLQERIAMLEGALRESRSAEASPVRGATRKRRPSSDDGQPRRSDSPQTQTRSPAHWNFASTLSQTTRIPTPPSYRYHEESPRDRMGPSLLPAGAGRLSLSNPIATSSSMISPNVSTTQTSGEEQSHGTLVIDKSGRSRYFGATAGTEWLKNVRPTRL